MNRIYLETTERHIARARQMRAEAMRDMLVALRGWFAGLFSSKSSSAAPHGLRNLGRLIAE